MDFQGFRMIRWSDQLLESRSPTLGINTTQALTPSYQIRAAVTEWILTWCHLSQDEGVNTLIIT